MTKDPFLKFYLVRLCPLKRASAYTYRVTLVVEYLGWFDLVLECSTILLGQLIATVAAHQPGELPKSKSTKTRYSATRVNL